MRKPKLITTALGTLLICSLFANYLLFSQIPAQVAKTGIEGVFHYRVIVRLGKLSPLTGIRMWWTVYDGPNLLVDNGKEFIEDQLGNSANSSVCQHIALSEDATSPAAGWTELISEITTGGLDRNTGAYASTGTGTWTIIYTFTATASFTVRLTGLHHSASDGSDGNLVAAVAFGTAATMISGDQLEVTWTCSVTE